MNVRRILSLDLATRIGWTCGNIGQEPEFGAHLLPSTGEDIGSFLEALSVWLGQDRGKFLDRFADEVGPPDLVVFEAPVLPRQTNPMTVRKLGSLCGFLEWRCTRAALTVREMHLHQMKRFWTGRGNATKLQMTQASRIWGYEDIEDGKNEDEADSLAGWWFSVNSIAPKFTARFAHGARPAELQFVNLIKKPSKKKAKLVEPVLF